MTNIRYSLQPGQVGRKYDDDYDPMLPKPYPIHLSDALIDQFSADKLIGFQRGEFQSIVLHTYDFEESPQKAIGLVPVFSDGDKFYAFPSAIASVTVSGE